MLTHEDRERIKEEQERIREEQAEEIKRAVRWASIGAACLFLILIGFAATFTVEEGHVGIVKTFGEAKSQVDPGLHFKMPLVDTVEEMEVRTRKNEENMPSATSEQMPVTVAMSVNWTVNKEAAFDLFKKYGGLAQFEERILDPRFRSATKAIIPKYTAEQLIQDRSTPQALIEQKVIEIMEDYPVSIDTVQIVNVVLPPKYIESIETKQREKNLAEAEKHKLEKQNLIAQQAVNTANAERDAAKAKADGEAYKIKTEAEAQAFATIQKGEAEAQAIKAKAQALRNNPLIIELTQAQQWDGALPQWVSDSTPIPVVQR